MPINEQLANRVRELIADRENEVEEKSMFGGLCFMVRDKMCVAVKSEEIMLRLEPESTDAMLEMEGVRPMVHSGKGMKGFLYVHQDQLATRANLAHWVNLAIDFNRFAQSSKVKKKSGAGKKVAVKKAAKVKKKAAPRKAAVKKAGPAKRSAAKKAEAKKKAPAKKARKSK